MCVTKTMTPNEKTKENLFGQLKHLKNQMTCMCQLFNQNLQNRNCLTTITFNV